MALASVPFGDSPLFRNLLPATGRTTDVLQPTNPAARKAILNSNTQFKVSPRGGPKIKVSRARLFLAEQGLEKALVLDKLDLLNDKPLII